MVWKASIAKARMLGQDSQKLQDSQAAWQNSRTAELAEWQDKQDFRTAEWPGWHDSQDCKSKARVTGHPGR